MGVTHGVAEAVAALFVPGDRPERFGKAASSGADSVILDLEDAIAGDRKELARRSLAVDFTALPVLVRINGLDTAWWRDDLNAAISRHAAAVVVPKAERSVGFSSLCADAEAAGIPIVALIETARGIAYARDIAAQENVVRLAFGSIDYCADLGCAHSREALVPARAELMLASRIADLPPPFDGVTTALDDLDLVRSDARYARDMGMGGKLAIHPRQIAPLLTGFQPDDAEIRWARAVLAQGDGAVGLNGEMVDAPVRLRARALLRRVGACITGDLPA